MLREMAISDLRDERLRQIKKWGSEPALLRSHQENIRDYLLLKYTVLGEEFGEVGRAILDKNYQNLYEELIQVAAVSVAIAETMAQYLMENERWQAST